MAVEGTQIFARVADDEQVVVYGVDLTVARDVAMILPLPVQPGGGAEGLRFIDLSGYPQFFADLGRWRPTREPELPKARGPSRRKTLPVHRVGAFDASYVPELAAMDRLDPRFRIPATTWAAVPSVQDFGFAVFMLRAGRRQKVHPMALAFRTRDPSHLFFPTLHIHDGSVHPQAEFRHTLFFQGAQGPEMSPGPAGSYVEADRCPGIVDPEAPVSCLLKWGTFANTDTWIPRPLPGQG